MLAATLIVGCAPSRPLAEVPIVGGTAAQRALARETLAAFDGWVGSGRIELRGVRFDEMNGRAVGRYHVLTRRIVLDADTDVVDVGWTLRHELCHALDYQEDLLASEDPGFDALVEVLEAMEVELHPGLDTRRLLRSEAMALLCEPGPAATVALQAECPGDPDGLAPLSDWFVEQVWAGEPDLLPSDGLAVDAIEGWTRVPFVPDGVVFLGTAGGAYAHLGVFRGDERQDIEQESVWIELGSGEQRALAAPFGRARFRPSSPYTARIAAPLPSGVSAPGPDETPGPIRTVVRGDRAAGLVDLPQLRHLGRPARRLVLLEDERWRVVDACPGEAAAVFGTPDALWLGWADGDIVRWAPIHER